MNLDDLALTRLGADLPAVDHQVIALTRMHLVQPPAGSLTSTVLCSTHGGNRQALVRDIAEQMLDHYGRDHRPCWCNTPTDPARLPAQDRRCDSRPAHW
jgi:hypothetical protein